MSDLREGLAKTLLDGQIVFTHERAAINLIDELVKVIRQHDGHAEFVRAVRQIGRETIRGAIAGSYVEMKAEQIIALCDAEMAKEQNNG